MLWLESSLHETMKALTFPLSAKKIDVYLSPNYIPGGLMYLEILYIYDLKIIKYYLNPIILFYMQNYY